MSLRRVFQPLVTPSSEGTRLQVSFESETALIYLWRIAE
jgi:hypothetical protein